MRLEAWGSSNELSSVCRRLLQGFALRNDNFYLSRLSSLVYIPNH